MLQHLLIPRKISFKKRQLPMAPLENDHSIIDETHAPVAIVARANDAYRVAEQLHAPESNTVMLWQKISTKTLPASHETLSTKYIDRPRSSASKPIPPRLPAGKSLGVGSDRLCILRSSKPNTLRMRGCSHDIRACDEGVSSAPLSRGRHWILVCRPCYLCESV
ncbi:hypothetical protein C8R45DRAFT_636683 [Mycena sanguinolenta]|nr:hypothetical protein C8R45DRAFT_636683 [Mycena sanguinolenta]